MKRSLPYVLSSAAYIAGIGLTITSAWLITVASFQPPIMTLGVAIVGVRFFGISRSGARYFERITSHKAVFDQLTFLRVRLYESITSNPFELVRDSSTGALVKRVVDDVERAQEYELRIKMPQITAYISVLAGVGLGTWIRPESIAITLPLGLLLLIVIPGSVKANCEALAREIEGDEGEYAELVEKAAHGIAEAQFYGYLDEPLARTAQVEMRIWKKERSLLKLSRMFQFLSVVTIGSSLIGLALLAQHYSSRIPAVAVTMLIFLPLVIFEAVTAWYPNLFSAGKLLLARAEIEKLVESKADVPRPIKALDGPVTEITARNVQVGWTSDEHFMEPVSFDVKSGQSLVIRGRSGSGKSTLAMALLGLLDYDGEILLNGVELHSVAQLSTHVTGAIQTGHIFNTSVRENLKIASPQATDAQLIAALKIVELDLLVSELGSGLDTVIGPMGRVLSGGEAKRICLARALLSPSEVLVLDEPTEHLDSDLAGRIEIRVMALHRILIVITHSGWEKGSKTLQLVR